MLRKTITRRVYEDNWIPVVQMIHHINTCVFMMMILMGHFSINLRYKLNSTGTYAKFCLQISTVISVLWLLRSGLYFSSGKGSEKFWPNASIHNWLTVNQIFDILDDPKRVFIGDETSFYFHAKSMEVIARIGSRNVYE